MASIAQAVISSISTAVASPSTESPATQPALNSAEAAPARQLDTVNLTETGSRNVSVAPFPPPNGQTPFQAAYFPPSSAPTTQTHATTGSATQISSPPTAAKNPTAQVASVASTASSATASQNASSSAASQAKLQQLNQILQQLGVNPDQISFSTRLALLPLVNDPAAIQQYIQGLPTQTAILNPATSQVLAPAATPGPASSLQPSRANPSSALATSAAGSASSPSRAASSQSIPSNAAIKPASPAVPANSSVPDTTGQKVNISV